MLVSRTIINTLLLRTSSTVSFQLHYITKSETKMFIFHKNYPYIKLQPSKYHYKQKNKPYKIGTEFNLPFKITEFEPELTINNS